jgi:mRNA interferase MazF
VKRGEVWTAAGGEAYVGKPRPVLVLQDDRFDVTDSITTCPFTSDPTRAAFRVPVEASPGNGLRNRSFAMTDKISSLPRTRLRDRIGRVDRADMARINRAVFVFLGLAGSSSR